MKTQKKNKHDLKSYDELKQLKEALENFEKRYNPFDVVNNNSEVLKH